MAKALHEQWSSWIIFVLAATGSAVGLGNIWKFPYITGQNGGGAFVLVYLLSVAVVGIPIMMAETMLGRRGRQSPINTLRTLSEDAGAHSAWRYLGWLGVLAGFLILSYYSVIAGWSIAYVLKVAMGSFIGKDVDAVNGIFTDFIASPGQLLFWHTLFVLTTMLIVARGVQGGLEKAVEFLTPGLFLILLVLVGYAMSAGDFARGLRFMFSPDFSRLDGETVLIAMGQAFFSLSLGMGAIMIYGSYLPSHVSIARTSFIIAGADTLVALLAGLAIFPIVFANGLEPGSGPGLIFQTLPIAFGKMPGGSLFGMLFFVLLVFAALSSSISLIEPAVAWLVENHQLSRKRACLWSGIVTWFLGIGTVFSFNIWSDVRFFGKTFFDLLDYVTANLMLPLSGLLIAVFAGWIMRRKATEEEMEVGHGPLYDVWRFLVCYVSPAAVLLVFLNVIGIL